MTGLRLVRLLKGGSRTTSAPEAVECSYCHRQVSARHALDVFGSGAVACTRCYDREGQHEARVSRHPDWLGDYFEALLSFVRERSEHNGQIGSEDRTGRPRVEGPLQWARRMRADASAHVTLLQENYTSEEGDELVDLALDLSHMWTRLVDYLEMTNEEYPAEQD